MSSGERRKSSAAGCDPANFDPGLCEQLGVVLLRMEDRFEAGKFLLLSGQRRPEYEHAIQLFFRRYA